MTSVQHRAIAAGFLHALQTTPALFQQWNALAKDDDAAIGALVQETCGLAAQPSKSDIESMAGYIDAHLKDQVAQLSSVADAPSHVGFIFLMQQTS